MSLHLKKIELPPQAGGTGLCGRSHWRSSLQAQSHKNDHPDHILEGRTVRNGGVVDYEVAMSISCPEGFGKKGTVSKGILVWGKIAVHEPSSNAVIGEEIMGMFYPDSSNCAEAERLLRSDSAQQAALMTEFQQKANVMARSKVVDQDDYSTGQTYEALIRQLEEQGNVTVVRTPI